jgi:ribosome-binding protein aMBF1 (putative translation factor)
MEKYELDLTAGDIGEIIEIIRVQHLRLHAEPFANKIGMKEKVLLSIEEGRGPHGLLALKKMNETFLLSPEFVEFAKNKFEHSTELRTFIQTHPMRIIED